MRRLVLAWGIFVDMLSCFYKNVFFVLLLCWLVLDPVGRVLAGEQVQLLRQGDWHMQTAKTLDDVASYEPAATHLTRFGGWALGPRFEPTGFFRTEKIDGRWWMIDPQGLQFLSVGVCSVHTKQKDPAQSRYRSARHWASETKKLLRDNGFNTLGCWSDWGQFTGSLRMPYTRRWNFVATFARQLGQTVPAFGHTGFKNQCMPIFHPDFESFCDEHAKQLAETKDDPWLIGHFSDNELPFRPNMLDLYLALPKDDHGYKAAKAWWDAHRKQAGDPDRGKRTQADQDAFLTFAAQRYYSVVGAAIRRYDPNHLFLGSRVHGKTIRPATFKGSGAVDVVSVNYYHQWTPEADRISDWAEASGKPVLISEWYAMALPDADPSRRGAGFRVKTHRGRGLFYQNYVLGLLAHPDVIGWHWFKYSADNGRVGIGVVDGDYRPYLDMLSLMKEINEQVYPLAEHFQEKR